MHYSNKSIYSCCLPNQFVDHNQSTFTPMHLLNSSTSKPHKRSVYQGQFKKHTKSGYSHMVIQQLEKIKSQKLSRAQQQQRKNNQSFFQEDKSKDAIHMKVFVTSKYEKAQKQYKQLIYKSK